MDQVDQDRGFDHDDPAERDCERRRRRTTRRTRRAPAFEVTLRGAATPVRPRYVFPANPLMNVSDASLEGLADRLREGSVRVAPPPAGRRPETASRRAAELSPAAALLPALRAALAIASLEPGPVPAPECTPAPGYAPSSIRRRVVLVAVLLALAAAAAFVLAI